MKNNMNPTTNIVVERTDAHGTPDSSGTHIAIGLLTQDSTESAGYALMALQSIRLFEIARDQGTVPDFIAYSAVVLAEDVRDRIVGHGEEIERRLNEIVGG